jgi:hypothetical protein
VTKPTDPQDWTRTAAADGTAAEATGTAEGTANGNSAQGTDAQADTERRTEDAWAPSNGIGQPSPSLGSPGAPVDPPTQPVPASTPAVSEPVVSEPVVSEPVASEAAPVGESVAGEPVVSEAAPVGESVAGEPAADQRVSAGESVSAGEPDESVGGRPATSSDPVGLISGQPEAPAAALPPPWQRVPGAAESSGSTEIPGAAQPTSSTAPARRPSPRPRAAADPGEPTTQAGPGGMAGSGVAPESGTAVTGAAAAAAAAAGAGLQAPGGPPPRAPRPARPEPARPDPAGRTGQSDLGRARTVSLDSGRLAGQASQEGAGDGGERARSGRAQGAFGMSWPRNRRPRQASLQLKRLDPWSVLKIALVLAVVLYLIWLVAVGVLYGVLDGIGVWDRLNGQYADLVTEQAGARLISAGRVFGAAAVIGAVNSLLFAVALSVGAFVYNVSADLVGGVEVTLSERD